MADLTKYPKTDLFRVKDTVGAPHPFCITAAHIGHAADHFSGMLGSEAIESFEKKRGGRPSCGWKGCNLRYDEHKTALLIECGSEDKEALKAYLLSIKDQTEADGFDGWALIKKGA